MTLRPHPARQPQLHIQRVQQPRHIPMRNRHPLRRPRRPRRVNDVRDIIRTRTHRRRITLDPPVVDIDHQQVQTLNPGAQLSRRHHHRRRRITQNELRTRHRHRRINRHIRRTRLHHRHHRHHSLHRPRHQQRHPLTRTHPHTRQHPRQPLRRRIQLRIRQRQAPTTHRHRTRRPPHLRRKHRRQRHRHRPPRRPRSHQRRPITPPIKTRPLTRIQHLNRRQPPTRIRSHRLQHPLEALDEALDGGGVEHVGAELDESGDPGGFAGRAEPVGQGDGEVHAGGVGLHGQRRDADVPQGQSAGVAVLPVEVLPGQHHLDQGVVGEAAGRFEPVDQHLERHVLVLVGGQGASAHLGQQVGDGGVAGEVDAQHQGVDEEAHQVVQRGVAAPGDRESDADVAAAGQFRQQHRERGLHHHEGGGVVVAGELGDSLLQFGGPFHRDGGPAVVGGRGVRPVGGQRQLLGHAGEGVFPVGDLRGDAAVAVGEVAQLRALPQRVVDVLHGQRGPRRGAARAPAGVGGPEVGDHGGDRPAVRGDVVNDGDQDVFVVGDPEQGCPHGYFAREVERAPHFGVHRRTELVFHPAGGVHDVPAEVGALDGHHQLPGRPVLGREQGAQAFLAGHHVGQRHTEGVGVQRPAQSQGHGKVVDRRRALDLVDDPQPRLRERQRDHLGPFGGRQRLQAALVAADAGRQLRDGGRLEHHPHGQAGVEGGIDGGHQAHRRQRVATEVEERVVHADALGSQHLGVDADQDLLGEGARGAVAARVLVVRCRQGAGVEFAVDRQRQRLQRQHRRWHHVRGQPLGQGGAELGRFRGSGDIAHQAFVAGAVLAGDHRRLGDAVQPG